MAAKVDADLREVIQTHSPLLLRCLDPSTELMFHLSSVAYLRQQNFNFPVTATAGDKIWTLLRVLREVPDEVYQSVKNGVIDALRKSGQDHVAEVFCGNRDKVMTDDHHSTLKAKKAQLCMFLDPDNGLLDVLESTLVISNDDVQHIRSWGHYNKAQALLEIIMRKSDSAFKALIDALDKTGQKHVAYILTRG